IVRTNSQFCYTLSDYCYGHGYQMGIDRYYSYAQHLASWGYIVILPTISNPFPTPEHYTRAHSMVDAARWTVNKNFVMNDLFYNKLAVNRWGFSGHSMGGGIALLAADTFRLADTLRAIVSLASPQTTPATHSEHLFAPKLILAGSVDNIAPWQEIRQAYWHNAPAPGSFAVINGANHGYFMDYSYFWENGGTATISRNQQQKISRKYMTAYFERYLHNDTSYWNYLFCYGDSIRFSQLMDSVEVRYNPVYLYEVNDFTSKNYPYLIYPNPAQNYLNIVGIPSPAKIFDISGQVIAKIHIPTHWSIDTKLKNGIYFIKTNKQLIKFIILR
ncbi:MAG: alpha/beta hydrolase, partial [candidate division WOR-3 bacterium]